MPKPNKYDQPRHVEIYNIKGVVKRTEKAVVMVLDAGSVIYEFHFGDPTQLMNFFVLMIDDMAKFSQILKLQNFGWMILSNRRRNEQHK